MLTLLLTLPLAAPQALPARTRLEELALEGAPIALVRVERLHEVPLGDEQDTPPAAPGGILPIAEVVVEQGLLGAGAGERSLLCLRRWDPGGESFVLGAGDRAVVFLDPRSGFHFRRKVNQAVMDRLMEFAGPRSVPVPLPQGVWRVAARSDSPADLPVVEIPSTAGELPGPLASHLRAGTLPLERLVAWLDAELDRVTPAVGASYFTTGPFPWSVEVGPDGAFRGSDEGQLEPDQLRALWQALEAERFAELPAQVGWNRELDQSWFRVWERRRDGYHSVRIFIVPPDELDSPEARDELARALRVLDALPGKRHPRRKP